MMLKILKTCILSIIVISCSDMDNPPELIEKMRPVLVTTQAEVTSQPVLAGEPVVLYFHFLSPNAVDKLKLTVSEPKSPLAPNVLTENNLIGFTEVKVNQKNGLFHIVAGARFNMPVDSLKNFSTGVTTVAYSVTLIDEDRALPIEGSFIAYANGEKEGYSRSFEASSILKPSKNAALSPQKEVEISADTGNTHGEPVKISWFVSKGTVKNRRASNSSWEVEESGKLTLVFTVRGKDSKLAAIRFVDVEKS